MANKVFVELEVDDKGALKSIRNFEDSFTAAGKSATKRAGQIGSSFDIATGKVTTFTKEASTGLKKTNSALSTFAGTLGAIAVSRGIAIINQQIQESIQLAIDFDKALIGVEKTTGLTGKSLEDLGKETLKLSKTIPKSATALLELEKIAGQLGVRGSKNLLKFAETMTRLEASTDIVGEEGAQNILKILNITEEGVGSIENFGSAVSFLGNNFNVTESQIVKAGTNIAAATSRFDLSSADVLALATATTELGIRAELSGSAVGRGFRAIDKSIKEGGSSFTLLQQLTGMTGEQLKKTFEKDAASVFAKFIDGLGKNLGQASSVLEQFGLKGEEIEKVLPSLAKKSDRLTRSISDSNTEFSKNTSLLKESAAAFKSLEARGEIADNKLDALGKTVGGPLADAWIKFKERIAETGGALEKTISKIGELTGDSAAEELAKITFQIDQNERALKADQKALEDLKASGGRGTFASLFLKDEEDFNASIEKTNDRLGELKKRAEDLKAQTFVGPIQEPGQPAGEGGDDGEDLDKLDEQLSEKNRLILNKRKELAISIAELEEGIANENQIAEEERTIADNESSEEEKINALVRLQEFEEQRIEIAEEAALARTQLIVDENERSLEQEKIRTQTVAKLAALDNKRKEKAQKAVQKKREELAKASSQAEIGFAKATADAVLAIAGDNGIAALAIGKAFAVADVFVKDGLARASAAAAALSAASAAGPAAPAVFSTALAGFNAAITKNTALSLGTIAAQTVAGVARMQTGGIVAGPQTGDRNLIRADGGEGILTREGVRAIADANRGGQIGADGSSSRNVTVQVENFIGEESFVAELVERLNDVQEFSGARLEARGET
ncbi:MAG: phage tail tape measure protein [Candidatus Hodarchaeales archaeon]